MGHLGGRLGDPRGTGGCPGGQDRCLGCPMGSMATFGRFSEAL